MMRAAIVAAVSWQTLTHLLPFACHPSLPLSPFLLDAFWLIGYHL